MQQCFFSRGRLVWVWAGTLLCLYGCSKRQPNAPTQDFARRHQCPVSRVESAKEGSDRLRVTGCGDSELYVRGCGNRARAVPATEPRQPITEAEAKFSPAPEAPFSEPGCAWTRQQRTSPTPGGAAPQPKWLSDP
jgi:hypothetical protein